MTRTHDLRTTEIGMLRIYLKPGDKASPRTARKLWSARPLYRELVMRAKADGLLTAVAHQTHYGFSNHGAIRENGSEATDPQLTICVEMIASRPALEGFCECHGALLADKVIVYKHLEHWTIGAAGIRHEEASAAELIAEAHPDAASGAVQ